MQVKEARELVQGVINIFLEAGSAEERCGTLYFLARGYQLYLGSLLAEQNLDDYMATNIEQNFGFIRENLRPQTNWLTIYHDDRVIIITVAGSEEEAEVAALQTVSNEIGYVESIEELREVEQTNQRFALHTTRADPGKIIQIGRHDARQL